MDTITKIVTLNKVASFTVIWKVKIIWSKPGLMRPGESVKIPNISNLTTIESKLNSMFENLFQFYKVLIFQIIIHKATLNHKLYRSI